jgi:hypothetical protein
MAEPGRYLIGESLREKLKSTIAKVDAFAPGSPTSRIKTVIEGDDPYIPKVFRVCTFTGAWSIGEEKTVTFSNRTNSPNTASAVNLFTDFTATSATTTCVIAKEGTAWYLVSPSRSPSPDGVEVVVVTSVSLGTAGLEFTTMNVKVLATVSTYVITIATTDCA